MNYVGENAVGWLLFPALLLALCLGLGLLAARVLRVRLPGALIPPLGLCLAIIVLMPLYGIGLHGLLPPFVVAAAAVAGLVVCREEIRATLDRQALTAAGVVYAVYLAPVVLSGDWTWTGYNFVNDTAVQLLLSDYVTQHGARMIDFPLLPDGSQPLSTHDVVVKEYLRTNYPLGSHELLGALKTLLSTDAAVLYQPYIGALAGFGAMALSALGFRSGLRPWLAAATAVVAAICGLLYQYGLQGNIKELAFFAIWAVAAALAREALSSPRPVAMAALVGIAAAAGVSVYSAAALPYVALLPVAVLLARWLGNGAELRFPIVRTAAAGAAMFVVAGGTALTGVVGFSDTAASLYGGSVDQLGHLLRPLPTIQAAGIWLSGNYREAVAHDGASLGTTVANWVIVAMLLAGIVYLVRRREWGPLIYFLPAAGTYAIFVPRVGTYADAKLLVALSPAALFVAAFALLWLRRNRRKLIATAAGATVAALVLVTAALAYHDVQLAPIDRMKAIEDFARHLPEDQPVLWNESEEFAKYFARTRPVNVAFENLTPRRVKLRRETATFGEHFDLDEQRLEYVQTFPWIAIRRAPDASRPPAGYELAHSDKYYELWHRADPPRVRLHLPLQDINRAALEPSCAGLQSFARRARPGERVVAAEREPVPTFDITAEGADRPPGWPLDGLNPGTVTSAVPGVARGTVDLGGGRYDVWLRGSFGRPVKVSVDGREVGSGRHIDGRRQWTRLSQQEIPSGSHEVRVARGGGNLAPGNGNPAYSVVGPVAFVPADRPAVRLREIDPQDARSLCGGSYDWIEIMRP